MINLPLKSFKAFLLCLFVVFCACNSETPAINNLVAKLTENAFKRQLDSVSYVVILPNTGCAGCITGVEDFAITNASKYPNILFVFTKIVSKKTLKNKLGTDFLALKNVYLDTENEWAGVIAGKNEIYPNILKYSNGKLVKIRYQSPKDTDVIRDLFNK